MKKMLSFLVVLFLVLFGCEKEPVPALGPTIQVSANPLQISYGSKSIVNLTKTNTDSVRVTSRPSQLFEISGVSGIFPTPVLTTTTTFTFTAYSKDGKTSFAEVTIIVKNEPTNTPTIVVTADPLEIFKGEMTTISWNSENALSIKATFGGVNNFSGSTEVGPGITTDYTVTVYGLAGKSASATVTVTIKEPVFTENEKLLNLAPWSNIKLEFLFELGGKWELEEIWECMKDDRMIFYLGPSKIEVYDNGEALCYKDQPKTQQGPWTLNGFIINTGIDYEIKTLNQDTLVWVYESPDTSGKMVWVRETFIHPK